MPESDSSETSQPPRRRGRPSTRGRGEADNPVRSLTRALTLLETVSQYPTGITLGDLAERLDLAPSTAHRLLKGLEGHRFVAQDEERGLWFVGVQAFRVGSAFLRARDFVAIARPIMHRTMEKAEESVNLAVRDGREATYLTQVECRQMMRCLATPGGRAPLHASGVGKALMMGLGDPALESLTGELDFRRLTDDTIVSRDALLQNLLAARRAGFAMDDEEHAIGLRCVAAPIFNEFAEPIAAVSLSGPKARIPDLRVEALGGLIRQAAMDITLELGGRQPDYLDRPALQP